MLSLKRAATVRLGRAWMQPGLPDGVWGRDTRATTIEFQTAAGLVANGTLNSATVAQRLEFDSDAKSKAARGPNLASRP